VEQLTRLADGGIQFHCQMVIVPGLNDGKVLEESLSDLWALDDAVLSVAVVPVGLTQFSHLYTGKPMDRDNARTLLAAIGAWADRSRVEHRSRARVGVWPDELYLLAERNLPGADYYGDFPQIENGVGSVASLRQRLREGLGELPRLDGKRIGVVTGVSMAGIMPELLEQIASATGGTFEMLTATNSLFGPTTTTAGLLVGADIRRALAERDDLDLALIPAESINDSGVFLDDESFIALREQLPMPCIRRTTSSTSCARARPTLTGSRRERSGRRAHRTAERRQVGAVQPDYRRRQAIVDDETGTTRDRHFAETDWAGRRFCSSTPAASQTTRRRRWTSRSGARWTGDRQRTCSCSSSTRDRLHPPTSTSPRVWNSQKPWLLVANKVDDPRDTDFYEFYQLGVDEAFPCRPSTARTGDLLDAVVARLPQITAEPEDSLRVALISRPNVGKSSFVNRLLTRKRLVVDDVAGTTRATDRRTDAVSRTPVHIRRHGRSTAQSKTTTAWSSIRRCSRRAIERGDLHPHGGRWRARSEPGSQDRRSPGKAGVADRRVNKWDLAAKDDKATAKYQTAAGEKAPFLKFVPFLFTSALTGQRVTRVLEVLLEVEQERAKRIGTAEVNAKLSELLARRQPPQAAGHEIKLNYATQIETAPPTIAIFGNAPDLVEEHYVRYLHNGFRSFWGFTGNPLRIVMKRKATMLPSRPR
jgi:GTP-binding protein